VALHLTESRGMVSQIDSAHSCPRCGRAADSNAAICRHCGLLFVLSAPTTPAEHAPITDANGHALVRLDDFQTDADRTGMRALAGLKPVEIAVAAFLKYWAYPANRAQLLGNGLRLGPRQLPDVYEHVRAGARLLGVREPEVFVRQDPVLNAFTIGAHDSHVIVLHSSLVESLDPAELRYIVGHELGHIRAGHVVYGSIAQLLAGGVSWIFAPITGPAVVALNSWSRNAERSADRAGLLLCGDLGASIKALLKLAVGPALADRVDVRSYLDQRADIRGFQATIAEWMQSHPFLVERVGGLLQYAYGEGQSTIERIGRLSAAAQRALPAPRSDSAAATRFCPKCNAKLSTASVRCLRCGADSE